MKQDPKGPQFASPNSKAKLARGGRPRREIDPARLKELLAAGFSFRNIARELRVGYGTVYRLVCHGRGDPKLLQPIQNPATEAL